MTRRGATLVIASVALALVAAACGEQATIRETIGTIVAGPTVVARDTAFESTEVHAPANVAFGLTLDNRDGQPHNLAVVAGGNAVFTGEIFTGPATRTYEVPALAPGTYELVCTVHPGMRASLVVTP
jgi:plastocyanin